MWDVDARPLTGSVPVVGYAPTVYQASPRRTIKLFPAPALPRRSDEPDDPLRWPAKYAPEVLDYTLDASGLDDALVAASAASSDIEVLATWRADGLFTVWLDGGLPGMDVPVTVTLQTASAMFVARVVRLRINEAPGVVDAEALLNPDGIALVDQFGGTIMVQQVT